MMLTGLAAEQPFRANSASECFAGTFYIPLPIVLAACFHRAGTSERRYNAATGCQW